jgi:hypothetical protein
MCTKGDPVGEGSSDQRRGDDGEHHLVRDVHDERDAVIRRRRHEIHSTQEGHVQVADDAADVTRETQRVAAYEPDDRGPAERYEALDHDREDILAANQPTIEKGETWSHEHDQARTEQHEPGVAGVEVQHSGSPSVPARSCSAIASRRPVGRAWVQRIMDIANGAFGGPYRMHPDVASAQAPLSRSDAEFQALESDLSNDAAHAKRAAK